MTQLVEPGLVQLLDGTHASLPRRFIRVQARLLDVVVAAVLAALATAAIAPNLPDNMSGGDLSAITPIMVFVLAWTALNFLAEAIPTALWGKTFGKQCMGIRVVSLESNSLPGWGKAIGRALVPVLLFALIAVVTTGVLLFYFIGIFVASVTTPLILLGTTWNKLGCGLHDRLSGTLVVVG